MKKKLHKFKLSPKEMLALRQAISDDEGLRSAIHLGETEAENGVTLEIEAETAEKLRQALTDQVAMIGFDEDYSLTEDGVILEELIDRFFIG